MRNQMRVMCRSKSNSSLRTMGRLTSMRLMLIATLQIRLRKLKTTKSDPSE